MPHRTAHLDRNIGKDFDGDGQADGVQTETRDVIIILGQAIFAADADNGLSRSGGTSAEITVNSDLSLTTPELRQAVYNYNFVVIDGSLGIHNTRYAAKLLQVTYGEVTADFPDAVPP